MTRRQRALIYDPITAVDWTYDIERSELALYGVDLVIPCDEVEARAELPEADVVIVSKALPNEDLRLLRRCRGILCYSVGMDGVDATVAHEVGIGVHNVPDYCTEEVSDHAVALLLALQRNLVRIASATASGDWQRAYAELQARPPRRVSGQVAGVVGVGRIGARVAAKCLALGMDVLGFDPYATRPDIVRSVDLATLLRESDAVVLCAAMTAGAGPLIDESALAGMKRGGVLVNVARGGLVDEAAVARALQSGQLRGAALDVRRVEPPDPATDALAGLDSVILTPHMAATSVEARRDLHLRAVDAVVRILGVTRGTDQ